MSKFIYPILTFGLASFVTYSGYCVYRRSKQGVDRNCSYDPYNLFESRLTEIVHNEARKSKSYNELCLVSTPTSRRKYFVKKVQAANSFIKTGNYDSSVDMLIRAMAACSRPAALLQCMSSTLPINVYRKLIQRLSDLT